MPRAVFFDRDDTLMLCRAVCPDGDLGDPALVTLVPGAKDVCRDIKDAGYLLIVVSNQGGVARGHYTTSDVDRVNARLNVLLGGLIDAFYYCPYHPRGVVPEYTREHPWRKPSPGMLLQAATDHSIDLPSSWLIGDAERDVQAAHDAGCRSILLTEVPGVKTAPATSSIATHLAPTLRDAARHILVAP